MDRDEPEIILEYYENNETDPLYTNDCFDLDSQHNAHFIIETEDKFNHQENNGRFFCEFCELNYSTLQTLHFHIKTKHPDEIINLKNNVLKRQRQRKHKCHICIIYLKSVSELTMHMNINHPEDKRELSCVCCKASFSNQNEIQDHMCLKHNIKSKIFKCTICGYWTIKKSHYKQHIRIHENTNIIQCQDCTYSTNYVSNFNTHRLIHSNTRTYICRYKDCDFRTVSKSSLWVHKFKHNPEKHMLFCDQCNYKTVYRQSLKKHLQSHERRSVHYKTSII